MKKNIKRSKLLLIVLFIIILLILFIMIYLIVNKKFFIENNTNNVPENAINENVNQEIPELILNDVVINESENYNIRDFVKSCTDNKGKRCIFKYLNKEMENYKEVGIYNIVIVAIDNNDNILEKSCILKINKLNETFDENNKVNEENNNIEKKYDNKNNKNNISIINKNNDKIPNNNNDNNQNNTTKPNNETTTRKNTTTKTTTTRRYKIDNLTETNEKISYKYGTKITEITYYNYDVYSDSSKELTTTNVENKYDYTTFNGTTFDLKEEALSLTSQNNVIYNNILNYVNSYRNEVGVENLLLDQNLSLAATIRALEMAWSNKFSHDRPNGSSCFSILSELNISYISAGENIAWGYWDEASVSDGWKNSPGHYANMISTNFSKIGVGYAIVNGERYWVQIFTD